MGIIVYNGVSTEEFGIFVESPPDYEIAERDYEVISIPGKSGDHVIDRGGFKNVDRVYNIAIGEAGSDFADLAPRIAEWLYSGYGYKRLEDSYHPDYFMMARVATQPTVVNILQQAGRAEITFNRKPQRYLKIGERTTKLTGDGRIYNPTYFDSEPVIKVFGSGDGTINVNNKTIQVTDIPTSGIVIDSEMQEAYSGTISYNQNVNYMQGEFPKLNPGRNNILFSGGITRLEIIPRWWTI